MTTNTVQHGRSSESKWQLPDGSRSAQSVWVWRGFLFMSLVAGGLTINFAQTGRASYAGAWAFITAGWLAISMWLWRRHVRWDDEQYAARQRATSATPKSRQRSK